MVPAIVGGLRGGPLDILLLVLDVGLVAWLFYRVLLLIRGRRALQMLVGLLMLLLLYWLSSEQVLHLKTTHWLLSTFLASLLIIVVVVFQNDIRRALMEVGRNPFLAGPGSPAGGFYEEIVQAASRLAEQRFGALLVVAREADLSEYGQDGIRIDAAVSQALLYAIFIPKAENPLHDGAVLIEGGRVDFAGSFLPLTTSPGVDRGLGTRHRAAIGITEETDAVAIVVSEERGTISLAIEGELERDLDPNELRARLQMLFRRPPERPRIWDRLRLRGRAGAKDEEEDVEA